MTAIDFSSFVDQLATVSGETILPFFRTALAIENKQTGGGFDPVTAADRAAEDAMRALIRQNFPDHGILGEEYGAERTDAEYVWVLDPIDGTKSFITGMVAWGTLIGLMRFGEPVFGMMNQPFTREKFSGDGGAARYRGPAGNRDLHVRACASLDDAILSTTSPLLMNAADRAAFGRLETKVKLSRYGGDCYAYCMMAAGQQIHSECFNRWGRDHFIAAGGDQQDRLADVTGVTGRGEPLHQAQRGIDPGYRRRTDAELRRFLQHRGVARVAHRIGGEHIADEILRAGGVGMAGANADGGTHGMPEREDRRRAIGQHHLLHDGFKVAGVFGKIPHMTLVVVGQRTLRHALSAPIKRRHGEPARAQIAHGLKIFLDVFGAALQHDDRAFAPDRRRPARKAQADPVRGLDAAGHHIVGHRIGGDGDEFHGAENEPVRGARGPYSRAQGRLNRTAIID